MKKRIPLLWFFILSVFYGYTQSVPFSANFSATPALEIIQEIESKTGLTVYFDPVGLDTLKLTATFSNMPVTEVLQTLFEPHGLFPYRESRSVILTRDVKIITQPAIIQSWVSEKKASAATKGLIFSRDYAEEQEQYGDIEKKVFEIGNRSNFFAGTLSIVVGYVKEAETGKPISGVSVYTKDLKSSAISDQNGFYSIALPTGRRTLPFQ